METAEIGPWRIEYEGGRLADIYHAEIEHAIDCTQVGDFSWNPPGGGPARQLAESIDLHAELAEWIETSGEDYQRELPYL